LATTEQPLRESSASLPEGASENVDQVDIEYEHAKGRYADAWVASVRQFGWYEQLASATIPSFGAVISACRQTASCKSLPGPVMLALQFNSTHDSDPLDTQGRAILR
jgi:hypothetical protein